VRGLRSTLVLLLVLSGLGAYIYFVTWRLPDPLLSTENRVYKPLEADDIQEFTLKAESGDMTTVRKSGEAWQIVSPRQLPAYLPQVTGVTSMLAYLDVERVIDEEPKDLAEYGLDNPRITIDFKVSGDRTFGTLLVGKKTPTGASLYAKRADEKRVFLIGQHHESSLNRTTFDLREKKFVTFTRDQVTAVDLSRGKERLTLKKDEGRWVVTAPISARADFTTVEGFIGSVEVAQMGAVLAEEATPEDLKKYGLDRPVITATFDVQGTPTTLIVGSAAGEDGFYAKDTQKPTLFTIEKFLETELRKPVDDFRRKDMFDFQTPLASRVEFTKDGQTVAFERVKGEGENAEDSWRRVSPNTANADKAKLEALLSQLAATRSVSFLPTTANTGLQKPALSVVVRFEDGKREERVDFGRNGPDAFASRPDQPGAAKIETAQLDNAVTAFDELVK
jgi:hypothetical protein